MNYTNNIIKKKILHNNTICCVDEHFPIHLKKPLFVTRWKLVFKNKIYSAMEKIGPQFHIYNVYLITTMVLVLKTAHWTQAITVYISNFWTVISWADAEPLKGHIIVTTISKSLISCMLYSQFIRGPYSDSWKEAHFQIFLYS